MRPRKGSEPSVLASYTPRYGALIQAQDHDLGVFYEETEQIAQHMQPQMEAADG